MKSLRWIVASSAALALVGCATQQKPAASTAAKPAVKPAVTAPAKTTPKVVAAKPTVPPPAAQPKSPPAPRVSEFQQAIDVLKLQGAELATYKAAWDAREKAVADFEKSADGKQLAELRTQLAAARTAKDDATIKNIQAQLSPLTKKDWDLRLAQRATVLGSLSLAQQQQWAAHLLNNWAVGRAVRKIQYSEDQLKQIRAICDKTAAQFVKADTIAKDPYLTTLKEVQPEITKQITDTVLSAEQKASLQQAAAAASVPVAAPKK